MGQPTVRLPHHMEEPTSADFGKSSEIDGPADVGSELFRDGVLRFGSMGIHPRL
jgi:hypothetical protein